MALVRVRRTYIARYTKIWAQLRPAERITSQEDQASSGVYIEPRHPDR